MTVKAGVSSVLSVMQLGSSWKAEFGAVSGAVVLVTQSEAFEHFPLLAKVETHPAGSAGAVTPSKFSAKMMVSAPTTKV